MASRSSLTGTYIDVVGTFASGPIPGSSGNVVLANVIVGQRRQFVARDAAIERLSAGLDHPSAGALDRAAPRQGAPAVVDARQKSLLERVSVVIVPRANPDGAHYFWRGTAS